MRSAIALFTLFVAANAATCGFGIDGLPFYGGCGSVINTGLLGPARTIANTCTCTKTTVRPKYLQVVKDVPAVRRVVHNIATPVVEQQQYAAAPLDNGCGCGCGAVPACGLASAVAPCGLGAALNPCGLASVGPCGLASVGPCGISSCGLPINSCGLVSPLNTCGLSAVNALGLSGPCGLGAPLGPCGICGLDLINGLAA